MVDTFRTDAAIEHINDAINSGRYFRSEINSMRAKKRRILEKQRQGFELVVFVQDCFDIHDVATIKIKKFTNETD